LSLHPHAHRRRQYWFTTGLGGAIILALDVSTIDRSVPQIITLVFLHGRLSLEQSMLAWLFLVALPARRRCEMIYFDH
jgi:hypothetical protein